MTRPSPDATGAFAPLLAELDALLGGDLPALHHLGPRETGGRLDQTEFGLLVGGAFQRGFSGCLTLADPAGGHTVIWFESGRPIDVVAATATVAERAAATAADVERWFLAVALWTSGRFAWGLPAEGLGPHRTHWLRHPAALVHESLQRRGTERLRRWLGTESNRLRLLRHGAGVDLVDETLADPALRSAVHLFDGSRSFQDVAAGSRLNEEVLLRALFALFCFGAMGFLPDGIAGAALPAAPELQADRARVGALFALAEQSDYFAFLGIDPGASRAEVAAAARRLSRELDEQRLHPDVVLATGHERAVIHDVLAEAARILGDDGLRARYRDAVAPVRPDLAAPGAAANFAWTKPAP